MKTQAYVVVAAVLFGGFAAATVEAGTKRVSKGRAGYAYMHVHRSQEAAARQKQAQRQTTIALDVDQKGKRRISRMAGRGAAGWRIIRR